MTSTLRTLAAAALAAASIGTAVVATPATAAPSIPSAAAARAARHHHRQDFFMEHRGRYFIYGWRVDRTHACAFIDDVSITTIAYPDMPNTWVSMLVAYEPTVGVRAITRKGVRALGGFDPVQVDPIPAECR